MDEARYGLRCKVRLRLETRNASRKTHIPSHRHDVVCQRCQVHLGEVADAESTRKSAERYADSCVDELPP